MKDATVVRSLASWLWLIECGTWGKALDASEEATGDLAAALMGHFAEVHVLRAAAPVLERVRASNEREGWAPASVQLGTVRAAPWPPGTFDCIALHDALVRRALAETDTLDELRQLHRLLRAGGWLALASPNPRPIQRGSGGTGGIARGHMSRLLRRAGFRDVRGWLAAPTLERSLTLIPDARTAVRAYEASDAMRGSTRWTRRAVAGLGPLTLLYPAYVVLARA